MQRIADLHKHRMPDQYGCTVHSTRREGDVAGTHNGASRITMKIPWSTHTAGAEETKSGSANRTASNVKCMTMTGRRPNRRYNRPKTVEGTINSMSRA